jgi:ABC-type lipoprotein export system ATPase subunit
VTMKSSASFLPASPPALRLVEVSKIYGEGGARVVALDRVSLAVPAGQCVAVVGRSGSGKSTLLHLAAGIDVPSSGEVWVDGREIGRLGDDALTRQRRENIGLVHQFFNLLPTLNARENVALPALLAGSNEREVLARADSLLAEVGLGDRARARPHTLSGGEMQRVALARALVQAPALVLADEPTGNLDTRSAEQVMTLLRDLGRRHGATLVIVTHSREIAATTDRVVELRDGRVVGDHFPGASA